MNIKLTSLADAYLHALETDAYSKYLMLPMSDTIGPKESYTYTECNQARKHYIKLAYSVAMNHLTPTYEHNISYDAAHYYSKKIQKNLLLTIDYLKQLCSLVRLDMIYNLIYTFYSDSENELLCKFNQLLQDDPDYYSLYKIDYFIEKVEIKEKEGKISQHPIGRFLEKFSTKNIEYYYEGISESVSEMEDDLNKISSTFYKQAHAKYLSYIVSLIPIIEVLDREINSYCLENTEVTSLKQKIISILIASTP